MSDVIKITDDEISSIKNLRDEIVGIISTVGQMKLTYDLMEQDLASVKSQLVEQVEKYKQLLKTEKEVIDELLKKYGMGSLDVETGVFTPENK